MVLICASRVILTNGTVHAFNCRGVVPARLEIIIRIFAVIHLTEVYILD